MERTKSNTTTENQRAAAVDLESLTQAMLSRIDAAWRQEQQFLFGHCNPEKSYLMGIKDIPIEEFQIPEVIIGLLSGVSGGKSSFLNTAICQYPISPVAATTTSVCAVETRRVGSLQEERIEVCLLTDDKSMLQKQAVCMFQKQIFNKVLFQKLFDYAMFLTEQDILNVKDTLSFFKDESGQIRLNRDHWRHSMLLLMIVLDAYVYQDQQNNPNLKSNYRDANEMRNELLQLLGVPLNTDYGLRLYWNSDRIPVNAVLVDLPGTGSATHATEDQAEHTTLVSNYLKQASSVICFFNDKATMEPDTEELLDTFIESNKLKGESSARLTFVLHKADIIDGNSESAEEADQAIRTVMNGFRQSFSNSADYPVYALSSWDGEWSLEQYGIPLKNLHHAAKFITSYKHFSHKNPSEEDVRAYQKERWLREYPYQISASSRYGRMNYLTFTNRLFTDYVRRIQCLQSLECLRRHMMSVRTIAEAISQEKTMFHIAAAYSPKLAAVIADAIQAALDEELDILIGEFQTLNSRMQSAVSQATGRISDIVDQFDQDYSVLNSLINQKLQNMISKLEKQNGSIPVDSNLIGTNEYGARNLNKILKLSKEIAQIDFIGYFKNSFLKLDQEFDLERGLYRVALEEITVVILDFPEQVVRRMEEVFYQSLEAEKLQNVQGFQSAFTIARDSTGCLMQTVCQNYVDRLKADTSVEAVLTETANKIQDDLMHLLTPYTSGNYGRQMLFQISKHHFFKANIINESVLKDFLTKYYISDFKEKMDKTLKEDIEGKFDVKKAHTFRMSEAMTKLQTQHLSQEATEQLRNQVKNACAITDKIIGDSQRLVEWKHAIDAASEDLQNFFAEGSAFAWFMENAADLSEEPWAAQEIQSVKTEAEEAKQRSDALLAPLFEEET